MTDADHDGLSDAREREVGSDPNNADTDGDGVPDLREVIIGTNPSDADTDHDGAISAEEAQKAQNFLNDLSHSVIGAAVENADHPQQNHDAGEVAGIGKIGVLVQAALPLDSPVEVDYYRNGGILPFVLRDILKDAPSSTAAAPPATVRRVPRVQTVRPVPTARPVLRVRSGRRVRRALRARRALPVPRVPMVQPGLRELPVPTARTVLTGRRVLLVDQMQVAPLTGTWVGNEEQVHGWASEAENFGKEPVRGHFTDAGPTPTLPQRARECAPLDRSAAQAQQSAHQATPKARVSRALSWHPSGAEPGR